jgi:hypothetical protein
VASALATLLGATLAIPALGNELFIFPNKGGVVRGGLGGAAVGAAVGAIAGDAGKGAAMGAAGGGLIGGMRRSSQRSEQKARKKDWERQQQGNRDAYLRAYTACLEGKGYTVK